MGRMRFTSSAYRPVDRCAICVSVGFLPRSKRTQEDAVLVERRVIREDIALPLDDPEGAASAPDEADDKQWENQVYENCSDLDCHWLIGCKIAGPRSNTVGNLSNVILHQDGIEKDGLEDDRESDPRQRNELIAATRHAIPPTKLACWPRAPTAKPRHQNVRAWIVEGGHPGRERGIAGVGDGGRGHLILLVPHRVEWEGLSVTVESRDCVDGQVCHRAAHRETHGPMVQAACVPEDIVFLIFVQILHRSLAE
mmetsp:Transcript_17493/g.52855  ORF Transcript_17493/g.52855 Transcript_17493/m.52855 type:complete len:253 (-) Transcript_17493:430-1188(-)